ncbi:uncharacterized protein LOC144071828 isoform X1 [Stigmatopora argus]
MVERRAAKKLSKEMITNWRGPVWYVSHLVAPNPHSVTTPVRLVWNSSQKFKGLSMNDILLKGPDVLNPIRAVLLRFRRGVHAALGDIKKMYNSVWLEEPEMHLHRFLWRDTEESEIEEYAITRVNIGDRPAGCIAQLAMRETAKLPMFAHLKEECRILEEDSYVDDVLTSHNDLEKLDGYTNRVEEILKAGGFILKPWLRSGQSGREILTEGASSSNILILPNQRRGEDDKALGVGGYIVESDKLYPMTSVNFSKRIKKMRVGQNLLGEEVRENTPKPLTRRQLLSQVAGLYDPIGLVTPAKQKGAILVRKAFQEAGTSRTQDTWDKPLSEKLREEAIQLFEEYVRLSQVTFHRSLTPRNWKLHPADSPHRNGAAEAAVRAVKRALHNLAGDRCFTWSEFQTFLYMAANLANERPIDARTQSREECIDYISPNTLLLGRTGPEGDVGSFDFQGYPYKRLRAIQTEVDRFWKKWSQLAGPNLFIRSKWHTTNRNVAKGDIVWLADQNALRGQYKLGRVDSVVPDTRGIVRDVHVKTFPSYPVSTTKSDRAKKPPTKIPSTILHRDVRRIIVLIPVEEQK